jgi:hypothetical protein
MDILNFINWLRGGRLVKTVDPAQALVPVATRDGKRDDAWITNAMTVEDLANNLDLDRLTAGTTEFVLDSNGDLTLNTGDLTIQTDPLLGDDIFIIATDRVEVRGGDKLLNANNTGGSARLLAGDGSDSDGIADAGDGGNVRVFAGDAGNSLSGNQANGGIVDISGGYTTLVATTGGHVYIKGGSSVTGIEGNVSIGNLNKFVFNANVNTLSFPMTSLVNLGLATASTGARAMINDSTVAASGNFGAIAVGGGANIVPVFSDGTDWLIG